MSALILNRDGGFTMPADGWYQVAPLGEFEHAQAGVVQVVDQAACEAMANRFGEEAKAENFAGLLIDFDHFSLDGEKRSEAAGWITALEARGPVGSGQLAVGSRANANISRGGAEARSGERLKGEEGERSTLNSQRSTSNGEGLWGKIRWSDIGEEAVKGGRYRFLSPVWRRGECEELGNGRLRPMRLHNAAVTNDPNLKGLRPLSNSGRASGAALVTGANVDFAGEAEKIANGGPQDEMLEWVLGEGERHCPGCVALAGQVHTKKAWEASEILPGSGKTYCGENCQCRLEPTGKAETGELGTVPLRKEKEKEMKNQENEMGDGNPQSGEKLLTLNSQRSTPNEIANGDGVTDLDNSGWTDAARAASLAVRRAKAAARKAAGDKDVKAVPSSDVKEAAEAFKKGGLKALSEEAVDALTEGVREKLRRKKALSKSEEAFLDALMDSGYAGESDSDPVFQWQEKRGEELEAKDEELKNQLAGGSGQLADSKHGSGRDFNAEAQRRRGAGDGVRSAGGSKDNCQLQTANWRRALCARRCWRIKGGRMRRGWLRWRYGERKRPHGKALIA